MSITLVRPAIVCVLALGATLVAGQQGAQIAPDPDVGLRDLDDAALAELLELHHTESQEVRMVLLQTVVTTRRGRPIRDLNEDDFSVKDDYVPQEIRYFDTEASKPIAIAFLLDLSGSMRQLGKLDEAKQSIRIFVERLGERDRMALICFADGQVSWVTEFTSDKTRFLRRLAVQEAYGQTALFDAIGATPRMVDDEIKGSKAVVLITDGIDNASGMNTFQATQLARSVSVPIYVVSLRPRTSKILSRTWQDESISILSRFSAETGGRIFAVHDPDDLKEATLEILDELRFQYILGYYPTGQIWDGSFRRIELAVDRRGAVVRTRRGYYSVP